MDIYNINIGKIRRSLPLVNVGNDKKIAFLNIYGDNELLEECVNQMVEKIPKNIDVIIAPELGGIVLASHISLKSNIPYIAVRKKVRPYMKQPIIRDILSIGTKGVQTLYLDSNDIEKIKGKNVLIIDEVISTGSTVKALNNIVIEAGGKTECYMCIASEGNDFQSNKLNFICKLPILH